MLLKEKKILWYERENESVRIVSVQVYANYYSCQKKR